MEILEAYCEELQRVVEIYDAQEKYFAQPLGSRHRFRFLCSGNPPDKPKDREVEFSKKEVLREEVKIYGQPDHCCPQAC